MTNDLAYLQGASATPKTCSAWLNTNAGQAHFSEYQDGGWSTAEVLAAPFVPEHLARTLTEFCWMAEGVAMSLRAEFAGPAHRVHGLQSTVKH